MCGAKGFNIASMADAGQKGLRALIVLTVFTLTVPPTSFSAIAKEKLIGGTHKDVQRCIEKNKSGVLTEETIHEACAKKYESDLQPSYLRGSATISADHQVVVVKGEYKNTSSFSTVTKPVALTSVLVKIIYYDRTGSPHFSSLPIQRIWLEPERSGHFFFGIDLASLSPPIRNDLAPSYGMIPDNIRYPKWTEWRDQQKKAHEMRMETIMSRLSLSLRNRDNKEPLTRPVVPSVDAELVDEGAEQLIMSKIRSGATPDDLELFLGGKPGPAKIEPEWCRGKFATQNEYRDCYAWGFDQIRGVRIEINN